MKKFKVLFSVFLVFCMVFCLAPLRGVASASENWPYYNGYWVDCDGFWPCRWYQVTFTPVTVPASMVNLAAHTSASTAGSTRLVSTSYSYYYNETAKTLIIRGTGEMPLFDEKHPAPWSNLKDKVVRVIFERNITTISANAFKDFSKLTSIILPATLEKIEPDAFTWSTALKENQTKERYDKLQRIEFSGDLDDLDEILKECDREELLDAKVVKVLEKDIQDEIHRLTWFRYMQSRFKITYDNSGRPVHIIEKTPDGRTHDTTVQYVDDTTGVSNRTEEPVLSVSAAEDAPRDIVEKRETVTTFPAGNQTRTGKEQNDLGQQTFLSEVALDSAGRSTTGEQYFSDEYGVFKVGTLESQYNNDGSGRRVWFNTEFGVGTQMVVELLNAQGQVLSVKTVSYDTEGNETGTSETKNDWNTDGTLKATQTVSKDTGTGYTTTEQTAYEYENGKLTSAVSSGIDSNGDKTSATAKYKYDSNGKLSSYKKTVKENGAVSTEKGSYTYDSKGLKTGKSVVTEFPGGTVKTETAYNDKERAVSEVTTTKYDDGESSKTKTEYTYGKDNVVASQVRTTTNNDGSSETVTKTYNESGYVIREVVEGKDASGTKSTSEKTYGYDETGLLVSENVVTASSKTAISYNASGEFTEEITELDESGNTVSTYSFDSSMLAAAPVSEEAVKESDDSEESSVASDQAVAEEVVVEEVVKEETAAETAAIVTEETVEEAEAADQEEAVEQNVVVTETAEVAAEVATDDAVVAEEQAENAAVDNTPVIEAPEAAEAVISEVTAVEEDTADPVADEVPEIPAVVREEAVSEEVSDEAVPASAPVQEATPEVKEEPAPVEEPAPEPEVKEEPAPVEEPAPEPEVKEEPAPVEEPAPEPEVKEEPAPVEEPAPESEVKEDPAPVEEPAPEPEVKEEPAPVEEPAPEPEVKEEPAPVEEPTPEPEVKEEPAPVEEPAPEPEVKEEPAPVEEPAPEPEVKEEPAPVEEPAPEPEVKEEPAPEAEEQAKKKKKKAKKDSAPAEQSTNENVTEAPAGEEQTTEEEKVKKLCPHCGKELVLDKNRLCKHCHKEVKIEVKEEP